MTHIPPPAEELRLLDAELRQLDARRSQLLARRGWLVATLEAARPAPVAPPRPETSPPRVQNVLLVLGGTLLTIAAMAFTLVGWGHLGITGRAAVLAAITAAALAAPVPLLSRGLRSTAEAVAGLGLALTVLDAYALHEVALAEADGLGYMAVAAAVLAAAWTAYGLLPRTAELRLPLPAALASIQLPLLLWVLAAEAGPYWLATALLVMAGFDTAVALRVPARSVWIAAAIGAYGMGAGSVLTAGGLSWTATGPSAAARAAALLLLGAGIALTAARRTATPAAPIGGLLLVAALGSVPRVALPEVWTVPVYLACGVALLAALRVQRLPESVRNGLVQASAAVQGLALLWALPLVAVTLLGPLAWIDRPWSGAPSDIRAAVTAELPWPPLSDAVPLVLATVATVLALTARPGARTAALVLAWATVLVLPPVLELPYEAGLLTAVAMAALALVPAVPTATFLAAAASLHAALLALAAQSATLTVLTMLTLLFATASRRSALLAAPTALAYATALTCAIGAAADWAPQHTALLVLTVPAAAALLAARLGGDDEATIPVEVTGAAAGLLAVGLTITDPPVLALVLALCAVITAATAIRQDRRPVGYVSAALFVLATWVRLAAWEVDTPEAYTLPVTIPALLVGALRRRRAPQTSSWTAYGPGLAATLVPSLLAAWGDAHWTRPLLLGLAALTVTLFGARHHLQAPLLLGGTVLVLDALHELAPFLIQVAGALPRWAPPAMAGLLLLALGATYEQRIRDAQRIRDMLTKLH